MRIPKMTVILLAMALVALPVGTAVAAKINLTMFYPIAVGGKPYQVINELIRDFESKNPDISVKAVYYGNYDDTRTKCLAAIKAGEPVQLSFSSPSTSSIWSTRTSSWPGTTWSKRTKSAPGSRASIRP